MADVGLRPQLLDILDDIDGRLAGVSLADALYEALSDGQIHEAHGVAGRIQDRVVAVLSRLTMEMVARENPRQGG